MAGPASIETTTKLASMRQIHAAIEHHGKQNWECAITLAAAAEGMLPATDEPHFHKKVKELAASLPCESVCHQPALGRDGLPTRSSGCTRSSSDGSRRRPCCFPLTPQPCCSGHCSPPARSTCAKSTAGKPSQQSPSLSQLTSPLETISSCSRKLRHPNSNHFPDGTAAAGLGDGLHN
jgi:hypothetical protein